MMMLYRQLSYAVGASAVVFIVGSALRAIFPSIAINSEAYEPLLFAHHAYDIPVKRTKSPLDIIPPDRIPSLHSNSAVYSLLCNVYAHRGDYVQGGLCPGFDIPKPFWSGLCPGPHWGSSRHSSHPRIGKRGDLSPFSSLSTPLAFREGEDLLKCCDTSSHRW